MIEVWIMFQHRFNIWVALLCMMFLAIDKFLMKNQQKLWLVLHESTSEQMLIYHKHHHSRRCLYLSSKNVNKYSWKNAEYDEASFNIYNLDFWHLIIYSNDHLTAEQIDHLIECLNVWIFLLEKWNCKIIMIYYR